MRIPLVGQAYADRSLAVGAQTCINVFPQLIEDPEEQAKNKAALYGCPGKHVFSTGVGGDVRGLWSGAGRLFVAAGTNLVEVGEDGNIISSYSYPAVDDGLPVQIFSNGLQLLLISGGFAYLAPGGASPVAITLDNENSVVNVAGNVVTWVSGDNFAFTGGETVVINGTNYTVAAADPTAMPPIPAPTSTQFNITTSATITNGTFSYTGPPLDAVSGAFLDGSFLVQRAPAVGTRDGFRVNYSALFDGLTWSSLDFFSKEAYPDNLRGIFADAEQLYLFGAETFEVWQSNPNVGVGGNAFQRIPGAMGRNGMFSTWCCLSLDGQVYFLGGDDRGQIIAYVLNGMTPVRISDHGVEAAWTAADFPAGQAVAYAYVEEGQSHFVVNFGLGQQTWAYNPSTGAWHQRAKWDGAAFQPYETNLHAFIPEWTSPSGGVGMHITGCTYGTGNVYESSIDFFDDEGTDICWQRALPYLYSGGRRQYFGRIDLEMEMGTATGGTPTITLDYSDDRGVTFINPRPVPLGTGTADSAMRAWWNRNGSSYRRIYRLTGVGQNKVAIVDLQCDITVGLT